MFLRVSKVARALGKRGEWKKDDAAVAVTGDTRVLVET